MALPHPWVSNITLVIVTSKQRWPLKELTSSRLADVRVASGVLDCVKQRMPLCSDPQAAHTNAPLAYLRSGAARRSGRAARSGFTSKSDSASNLRVASPAYVIQRANLVKSSRVTPSTPTTLTADS
jgi:hypothetical protein